MKRLFGEYLTSVLLSQHTEQEAGGLGRFPNGTPFLDLIPSMRTPRLERAVAINSDGNIPIGVFYQNEHIPTFEDRVSTRIDNYLASPPSKEYFGMETTNR